MAVRKLYGIVSSTDTMRALASLFEHELEFEFIPLDLKAKASHHNYDPILSLSPFGQLLVFQDGDLTLLESRTIMRFISHKYGKPGKEQVYLVPKQQGIAATWIDVEDHQFDPPASKLRDELVEKTRNGLPTDETVVAEEEDKLIEILDVYEERLSNSKYLGGDRFTSADLTHLPNLYYLTGASVTVKHLFDERPHVRAWCTTILSRPAWIKVVETVQKIVD
ncbi:glutathione S-transferase-like [Quillaja saponaria]|uniref:glutathione transferase n=1 Tax=Quillaja saponaria TaxID=32244 RepID=A0AAD7Q151_QUISA|nr:glutathione S-transferase-like [Quillaja saponaria]